MIPGRILIIEDSLPELDLMCYLLKRAGYEPEAASSGEEGLEMATRTLPDLVLLDLRLPGMDGYEVVHQLRQEPSMQGKPIVAVSCTLRPGDEDRVRAEGFDGQILKPLVPERFARQVSAFLALQASEAGAKLNSIGALKPDPTHGQDPDQ